MDAMTKKLLAVISAFIGIGLVVVLLSHLNLVEEENFENEHVLEGFRKCRRQKRQIKKLKKRLRNSKKNLRKRLRKMRRNSKKNLRKRINKSRKQCKKNMKKTRNEHTKKMKTFRNEQSKKLQDSKKECKEKNKQVMTDINKEKRERATEKTEYNQKIALLASKIKEEFNVKKAKDPFPNVISHFTEKFSSY